MNYKKSFCVTLLLFLLQVVRETYSSKCKCGKPYSELVIGGLEANVKDYPWLVAIYVSEAGKKQWRFNCGASLIHPKWAVTAGHCITNTLDNGFVNKGKCYNEFYQEIPCFRRPNEILLALSRTQGEFPNMDIAQVLPHPKYHPKGIHNDLALLKLKQTVKCSDYVNLVCMTEGERMDYPRKHAMMAGWGKTESSLPKHPKLKQTLLRVLSRNECSQTTNLYGVLCTTGAEFFSSPCKGDSGGPLMHSEGGLYYITGVVSHGSDTCEVSGKMMFTKLTDFMSWIRQYVPLSEVRKAH